MSVCFFFQAEDGIRDLVRSRGLGDVYKRQLQLSALRQGGGMMPLLNIPWAQLPNQLEPAKYQRMVFGIVLVVMMIFRTEGLLPARRRRMEIEEALHPERDAPPVQAGGDT